MMGVVAILVGSFSAQQVNQRNFITVMTRTVNGIVVHSGADVSMYAEGDAVSKAMNGNIHN